MNVNGSSRGLRRGTVVMVLGLVGALLLGSAGGAVGASLITSAKIKNGTIKNVDIRKNTITGKKIKNGSIVSKDIKDGTIALQDVKVSSLTGDVIKDGSLGGVDVAAGALTGEHLADGSVEATDLASGVAASWAVVGAAGTLVRGSEGVSSNKLNPGRYEVFLNRPVAECAFVATLGHTAVGNPVAGEVGVATRAGDETAVYVATRDSAGAFADRSFHLAVHC